MGAAVALWRCCYCIYALENGEGFRDGLNLD